MKRISSTFAYKDIKSVEVRVMKGRARVEVLRQCRQLGAQNPTVRFNFEQVGGHSRQRGKDVVFQCEAYAEIQEN